MATPRTEIAQRFGLPQFAGEPVFREPWEAQAFALTLHLHEAGHFTWDEWATMLSTKITEAQAAGDPDDGTTYYSHWLAALEALVVSHDLSNLAELETRKDAWDRAVRNTPHGQPIELANADNEPAVHEH